MTSSKLRARFTSLKAWELEPEPTTFAPAGSRWSNKVRVYHDLCSRAGSACGRAISPAPCARAESVTLGRESHVGCDVYRTWTRRHRTHGLGQPGTISPTGMSMQSTWLQNCFMMLYRVSDAYNAGKQVCIPYYCRELIVLPSFAHLVATWNMVRPSTSGGIIRWDSPCHAGKRDAGGRPRLETVSHRRCHWTFSHCVCYHGER